ncbi:MAG: hypothetical protein ACHQ7N_06465 [Candidatus Methylomirabilales bacterium]
MMKPNMDDITPDTLFDAVKSLSPAGRAELLAFLRAVAIQLPPETAKGWPTSPTSWSFCWADRARVSG